MEELLFLVMSNVPVDILCVQTLVKVRERVRRPRIGLLLLLRIKFENGSIVCCCSRKDWIFALLVSVHSMLYIYMRARRAEAGAIFPYEIHGFLYEMHSFL